MRIPAKLALCLAALACLAGAVAASASAASDPERESAFGAFTLEGTNGYRIFVIGFADSYFNVKGAVSVWVIHKGSTARRGSAVEYQVPAKVTSTLPPLDAPALQSSIATSIQADLGALGRISLQLKLSGGEKTYRNPCHPMSTITYPTGSYEGSVEFHGEEGFTEASATQTPLSLQPLVILDCAKGRPEEEQGPVFPGARLRGHYGTLERQMRFSAIENRAGSSVRLSATLLERHDPMRIRREVTLTAPASAFSFDPMLRTASLTPPAPFSGSARFRRAAPRAKQLTGNLSIDFPGKSNFRAAGPGFRASLVHAGFGKSVEI